MVYRLSQHLTQNDLIYWMLCAGLRPDRNCRLVSHPYYTKHASEDDNTCYLHIDMNVRKYFETGRGGNIIQGSARVQGLCVWGAARWVYDVGR